MGQDDVIDQLLSGMRGFLAESAFVHAHAAARMGLAAEPNVVMVDFGVSAARPRARTDAPAALEHQVQARQRTC